MATRPVDGTYSGGPTNTAAQAADEALLQFVSQLPGGDPIESLTIAAGVVTPSVSLVQVDTEGAAASDDLDTIAQTNFPAGSIIIVRCTDASRVVTLTQAGNCLTRDAKSIVLKNTAHFVALARISSSWQELVRNVGNELETVRALTADTTLVASDSGITITNTGAAADRNHTLPAATVGMRLRVRVTAAFKIKLTATNGDTIRDDDGTTVSAANGNTEIAATVGNLFDIECFEAAKWVVVAARGTLTTT